MERSLDISINNISKIEQFDFKDVSVVTFLNLSSNVISHVEDRAFLHLDPYNSFFNTIRCVFQDFEGLKEEIAS
ncbi:unnamed protein product [Coregonus sp. 'balchen']|nr:unnamed protein product [Coregonus sp. 'balchen']